MKEINYDLEAEGVNLYELEIASYVDTQAEFDIIKDMFFETSNVSIHILCSILEDLKETKTNVTKQNILSKLI